jgi:hypothetical protein
MSITTPEWLFNVDDLDSRFPSDETLLAALAPFELSTLGRFSLHLDRGPSPRWRRLLLGQLRDITPCLSIEWAHDYASLIFLDENWSEYRVLDQQHPVSPPLGVRALLAHGELLPHPVNECMLRDRAFEAVRHFILHRTRPDWLAYRFVS